MSSKVKGEVFQKADALAEKMHAGTFRKGTTIPYVSHPRAVAENVLRFGGDEVAASIALLHDTLEDCDATEALFTEVFGVDVGHTIWKGVVACSDGVDENGKKLVESRDGESWKQRKIDYLNHLRSAPIDRRALLVSASDKLHNAMSIVNDLRNPDVGTNVWSRFNSTRDEIHWYYSQLVSVFEDRQASGDVTGPVVTELANAVQTMARLSPPRFA